jgi:hypothetical protein
VPLQRGAAVPCTSPSISLSALSAHLPWTIETHGEIPHSHGPAEHCRRGRLQSSLGNAANGGAERSYCTSLATRCGESLLAHANTGALYRGATGTVPYSTVSRPSSPSQGPPGAGPSLPVCQCPNRRRQASAGRAATMTPPAEARNTIHQVQLTAKPGLAFVPLAAC